MELDPRQTLIIAILVLYLGRWINGRVSLRDRGRVNIGVGYAISSNQIKLCLPELRSGRIVQHGTLNATVATVTYGSVATSKRAR